MRKAVLAILMVAAGAIILTFQNCQAPTSFDASPVAETTSSIAAPRTCSFNGLTVNDAGVVKGYAASTVAAGSTCAEEVRVCANGVLTGSFPFATCSVNAPASCLFNGVTVPNGQSVPAYAQASIPAGQACVGQTRRCTNGVLSGSYLAASCTVQAPPAQQVSCPQLTKTVATDQAGVTCTDTLEPYSGTSQEPRYSPRSTRDASLGTSCSVHPSFPTSTPYFGTVSGGQYGTCQNYCAIKARCTSAGWVDFGFTW